ncbi:MULTISPECIES: glyoxylate carboligase [Streptomycetaceae]|uniref:Glyoxylate carboligase n=1 Tax=Streptantibioticus cattleyicolor (strain ATCC 35852 / DSM 46488 / JCM 4925 / NBRC 14057 / NRRL 8057) TaxID=1003195 RepID=G8WV52_STREN|nr:MULTISPECIES: glyoxylate carboligase [Streptomycetaceae]AEW97136.1 glyoxylate carboligase [Streptantibioticus cattleyicolor NRRL 8057 = DSM 46488]MYS61595.1 glyoxylate carboligase [Streptomyces sp. SID5468]
MTARKMPAMEAVVHVLKSEGVDIAYGCPGAAILPLYKAMETVGGVEHLTVRHEEGATHMADGWARTTGKVGVAIGTSGPAGTNMITGLYTAIADSVPIICVTGQAASTKLHQEAFQAVDIVEIARPVTKWAVQIKEAAQAPWIFREAFRIARSGRPGPVLVDIPIDVAQKEIWYDPQTDAPLAVESVKPHLPRVEAALDLLLAAEKPLILAGGGVIIAEAADEVTELAELLRVPVQVTLMGKGAIREDHELYAGMTGVQTSQRYGNASFLESDTVLAVGARFGDRHTGALDTYRGDRKFIHVDIEPTQLGKVFEPDLGIVSDARLFLRALIEAARARGLEREDGAWVRRVRELRTTLTRREDFDDVPIKAPRVYKEINEVFGEDTYFVTAIGLYQIWGGQHQKAYRPRHYQICGQAGPLGWEIPAAIGVKKALVNAGKDNEVVGIVGDYGFQYMVEELAVAAQYNVPYVIIMLNNEYLGLIRQASIPFDMNYQVDIHYDEYGSDNVKIMEAYGCSGTRVLDPADIRSSIEWARKQAETTRRPVLVEIMIEREANTPHGPAIDAVKEFEPLPEA